MRLTLKRLRVIAKALLKSKGLKVSTLRAVLSQDNSQTVIAAELFQGKKLVFNFPRSFRSQLYRSKTEKDPRERFIPGNWVWNGSKAQNEANDWRFKPTDQQVFLARVA